MLEFQRRQHRKFRHTSRTCTAQQHRGQCVRCGALVHEHRLAALLSVPRKQANAELLLVKLAVVLRNEALLAVGRLILLLSLRVLGI